MGESPSQESRDVGAVRHALDIGYRLLDTAEKYGDGGAERIIGRALDGFGGSRRSELFIVSKVVADNASADGVQRACEASIERMGCSYLDLYLLHWPSPQHSFAETLTGFTTLVRRGLIRNFGVSNFEVEDLIRWRVAERALGLAVTAGCNQIPYSLEARTHELVLLPWQRRHGIKAMAYSPFGRDGSATLTHHPVVQRLGRERGITAAQIALAWCVREPQVIAIAKSTDAHRLQENLSAMSLSLTVDEIKQLDHAFPLRHRWLRRLRWLRSMRAAIGRMVKPSR